MITKTNTNTSTTGFSSDNPSISQPKKNDWRKFSWSFETLRGTNRRTYMRRVAGKERRGRHLSSCGGRGKGRGRGESKGITLFLTLWGGRSGESKPGGDEISSTCPDRPWFPPRLL
jgi:hypothetical protein